MKFFKYLLIALQLFLVTATWVSAQESLKQSDSTPGYVPKEGFIPDRRTAIAVAIAVLIPIYGEEEVRENRPFVATLKGGKWTVTGSLPKNMVGGVPEVQLSKSNGKILKISAGK
ncbi:hypothetical protein CR105_05165 [Massilia eurypsychrophila]|jgi:hypothetical protein|uniref:NTF2 fold domain-containing protein n=1 Tax=Massilia eurypsychrophila TaxID=1485217 RepID=A0A2G8TLG5_9BURK|nr:NTF2 fold immunity protein [Massilia eurypsychrophila]PIL46458.1 hypothetical protein CR105_05165 [Massilia eurypsychrophila]